MMSALHDLPSECTEELNLNSKLLSVSKEVKLVSEGQYSDKVFFVVKGCVRAFYIKEGKDISDWFAFENDFVSAINSFFLEVPSAYFIETVEPAVLLEVRRDVVRSLCDQYRAFERLQLGVVTKTMLQLQSRIVSMQFENARQKYENLLGIRPDIVQRVPLKHIASYLGITLETLSRIRNQRD